jgi:hypothetical protein
MCCEARKNTLQRQGLRRGGQADYSGKAFLF